MWKFKEIKQEKMADGVMLDIVGVEVIKKGEDAGYYNPVVMSTNPYRGDIPLPRTEYALGPNLVANLAKAGIEGRVSGFTFWITNLILKHTN